MPTCFPGISKHKPVLIAAFISLTAGLLPPSNCPAQTQPDLAQAQQLEAQARTLLQNPKNGSDITQAIALLRKAAETDSIPAILLLASTYEIGEPVSPNDLSRIPDFPFARRWYARAADLGSSEAAAKLLNLPLTPVPDVPAVVDVPGQTQIGPALV